MALFDLGFLADRVKIFSLEDETVNFLLGRSQVDYCLSRCSASSEAENLRKDVARIKTQPFREGTKRSGWAWWLRTKTSEVGCTSPDLDRTPSWGCGFVKEAAGALQALVSSPTRCSSH